MYHSFPLNTNKYLCSETTEGLLILVIQLLGGARFLFSRYFLAFSVLNMYFFKYCHFFPPHLTQETTVTLKQHLGLEE
jgi:hypothetical protein